MLLNNSGTKNARETRFVPESSWHVTASEFQSFRAASGLLDNENDQVGGCAPKLTQQASLCDFVHGKNHKLQLVNSTSNTCSI